MENVAILTYLARRFPEAQLLPHGIIEEARCISAMAWSASAVHPTFAHIIRPEAHAAMSAGAASSARQSLNHFAHKVGYLITKSAQLLCRLQNRELNYGVFASAHATRIKSSVTMFLTSHCRRVADAARLSNRLWRGVHHESN